MKLKLISLMIGLSIVGMQEEWSFAGNSPVRGRSPVEGRSPTPARQQADGLSDGLDADASAFEDSEACTLPGTPVCIRTDSTSSTPKNVSPRPATVNETPVAEKRQQQMEVTPPIAVNRSVRPSTSKKLTAVTSYDYTQVIDFQLGDLIYGLQDQRDETVKAIRACDITQFANRVMTIDQLNNRLLQRQIGLPLETFEAISTAFHVDDRRFFQDYAAFMMGQFDFKEIGPFLEHLDSLKEENERFVIAKLCTDAIFLMQKRKHRIHFILDGLNFKTVIDKDGNKMGHQSYTSQELRAVYEFWKMDKSILKTVLFYKGGQQLKEQAPWLTEFGYDMWDERERLRSPIPQTPCVSSVGRCRVKGSTRRGQQIAPVAFSLFDEEADDEEEDDASPGRPIPTMPLFGEDTDEFSSSVDSLVIDDA